MHPLGEGAVGVERQCCVPDGHVELNLKTEQHSHAYCGQQTARPDRSTFPAAETGPCLTQRPRPQRSLAPSHVGRFSKPRPQRGLPAKTQVPPPNGVLHPFNQRVLVWAGFLFPRNYVFLHLLTSGLSVSPLEHHLRAGLCIHPHDSRALGLVSGPRELFFG